MYHQLTLNDLKNTFPYELIDRIQAANQQMLVRDLARIATIGPHIIGEKTLWKKLRQWKMIRPGTTEPYQKYLDGAIFSVKTGLHMTSNGSGFHHTTQVTPKGQIAIIKKLQAEGFYDN